MWKFYSLFLLLFIASCGEKSQEPSGLATEAEKISINYNQNEHKFDLANLDTECNQTDNINCAIDKFIKCSIKPELKICNKKELPRFIFMQDDGLERPSSQTYSIVALKNIDDKTIQVKTISTCNGKLFGLCNGNIVYLLVQENNQWVVKDLYAIN